MNKIYRTVYNTATGTWVVASEFAKGRTKSSKTAMALAVAAALALPGGVALAGTDKEEDAIEQETAVMNMAPKSTSTFASGSGSIGTMGGASIMADGDYAAGGGTINALASVGNNTAIGAGSVIGSDNRGISNAIAIGGATVNNSGVTGAAAGAIGIGAGARVGGNNSIVIGAGAANGNSNAVAIGANTVSGGGGGTVALGTGASTSASGAVAVGSNSLTSGRNSASVGVGTGTSRANAFSVGNDVSGTNPDGSARMLFSRQVVNVAAGTQANDAVNVSQLTPVVTALGGGASIDAVGTVTGPTYNLANGGTQTTVGGALTALDSAVSTKVDNTAVKVGGGTASTVSGNANNIAIGAGANSSASPVNSVSIALGASASSTNAGTVAVGTSSNAGGSGAVALGLRANASGAGAVALGVDSVANQDNTVSVGNATSQRRIVNLADGTADTDAVNVRQLNTVDGRVTAVNTRVDGIDTRVLNNTTDITNIRNEMDGGTVGLVQQNATTGNITVASGKGGKLVDFSGTDGVRKLTGIADGDVTTTSTDAVTGRQLNAVDGRVTAVNTRVDGIDTRVTINEGNITTLTTNVNNLDGRMTTAEGDITNIRNDMNSGTIGLVQQNATTSNITVASDKGGKLVDFSGTDGVRKLTGIADGDVTATSTDAVTGRQLNATNTNVTNLSTRVDGINTRVTNNETAITNIRNEMDSGTVGLVQQDATTGNITVASDRGGKLVDFSGTDGVRKLTGIADGDVTATSTDAVTGRQLNAVDGRVTAVNTRVDGIDTRVTNNETAITNIRNEMDSGTVGLVQQNATTGNITVASDTGGKLVDFSGTDGVRKLTGIADGDVTATSTDAVTGRQLNATNTAVEKNTADISTLNTSVTNIDGRVTKSEGDITTINTKLSGLEGGSVGLVQQDAASGALTVASGTGGTTVNFAGTGGARQLNGVANGTHDSDAVTLAQLKASGLVDKDGKELGALVYDDLSLKSATLGGTGGTYLNNVAPGLIGAGSMQAVNGGQLFAMQQKYDKQFSDMDDRVGKIESGGSANPGLPPGTGGGVGEGSGGPGSIVVGDGADASGKNSSAIGSGVVASGDNSTAIGQGAKASGENSVALGQGSVADRDNEVSIGAPGQERYLGNVKDGVRDTDAVNVRQLNNAIGGLQNQVDTNRRDAMGGTAAAMAVAGLPQSSLPGKTFMAVSGSTYGGEQGTALGVSYMSKDGRWIVKSAVNTSTRGEVGAVVGGGFYW